MAKKPDYRKITITSLPDSASGGAFDIKDIERDMRNMVNNAVKSALPEGAYYKLSPKSFNKQGEFTADLYVHTDSADLTAKSMNQLANELYHRRSGDPRYDISLPTKVGTRTARALREEEEEQSGSRGETEGQRFRKSSLLKLIGLVTSVADITRRILSSVITFSQQTAKDMITAHNLGMSYETVRRYRQIEATHGMKEGTVTGAVADIQSKFGNITTLDEKSLEYLAIIMGNKVAEMATMGLGASNPEAIVSAIVDRANELANSGYNSVGQYVGEQQARRELYSYLLKVSPQIADIFATMQEEQHNINSIFRGKLDTYEDFKNSVPERRGQNIPAQDNVLVTTSQEWNVVKTALNDIKQAICRNLAPDITAILRKIADWRFGLSEVQNEQRNIENKEANKAFIDRANKQLSLLDSDNLTEADRQRKLALQYYIKLAEKENNSTGNIGYAVPTEDEIFLRGLRIAQNEVEKKVVTEDYAYSPELRHVVDFYVPESKLNKFKEEYKVDLAQRAEDNADKQVAKVKKEREDRRTEQVRELKENARKWAREQMKNENSPYYSGKNILGAYKNKGVKGMSEFDIEQLAMAEYLYAGKWDSERQELWTSIPVNQRRAIAIAEGALIYDPVTKGWGGIKSPDIPVQALTLEEEMRIRKLAQSEYQYQFNEEDFYVEAFKNWEDVLYSHLVNTLKESLAEKAKEGTPLYDLDVLQQELGAELEGLSKLVNGNTWGTIESKATDEGNEQIIHRIILNVNSDKDTSNDIELMSYRTNRISDVYRIAEAEIKDGKVSWVMRGGASTQK